MKTIFTFEKIYDAYLECRRNKRGTVNAIEFEMYLDKNLAELQSELFSRSYLPGRSICFAVKHPKPREIFAAGFRDRVVHHLLVREVIERAEKMFFFNSFACRKGKGTHAAVGTLRRYIKSISRNGLDRQVYYTQLDLSNFFVAIDHDILYKLFERLIDKCKCDKNWREEMLWLAQVIIFHRPQDNCLVKGDKKILREVPRHKSLFNAEEKRGLPIGNYSSQFFANLYLHELDYFAKQGLRSKYYLRYVDDFIFLDQNKEKLEEYKNKVAEFLQRRLKLSLNHKKTKIGKLQGGIDFLGYFIKPSHVLVRRRVVNSCRRSINRFKNKQMDEEDRRELESSVNSYLGHFKNADSYHLREKILKKDLLQVNALKIFNQNYDKINIEKMPDFNEIMICR